MISISIPNMKLEIKASFLSIDKCLRIFYVLFFEILSMEFIRYYLFLIQENQLY